MKLKLRHHFQKDGYSCGICSARTVYDYYSLSTSHLREKLKLIKFQKQPEFLTGTLPWDYLKCLASDGLECKVMHVDSRSMSTLRRSIDRGHPAILLTGTWREDLHWTVIGGYNSRGYHIMDSLEQEGWRVQSGESIFDTGLLLICIKKWDGVSRKLSWRTIYDVITKLPRLGRVLCTRSTG